MSNEELQASKIVSYAVKECIAILDKAAMELGTLRKPLSNNETERKLKNWIMFLRRGAAALAEMYAGEGR